MRPLASRVSWLLTGVFAATAAVVTLAGVRPAEAQFTPFSHNTHDHAVSGISKFEVHMGPRREFAIFKGVQEAHRDHDSPDNLLKPYRVVMDAGRAKQRWEIPSLNLAFTVTLAGGSRTDCESWYILLEPLEKTSH